MPGWVKLKVSFRPQNKPPPTRTDHFWGGRGAAAIPECQSTATASLEQPPKGGRRQQKLYCNEYIRRQLALHLFSSACVAEVS